MTGDVGVGPFKLASVFLRYPTVELHDGGPYCRDLVRGLEPAVCRPFFARFLDWLVATPAAEVAETYVATFDLSKRRTLYLTYYRYGDTRKRGMSLVTFKETYRRAGFVPVTDELPDYLPIVLEFADLSPKGRSLLTAHRAELEVLRGALQHIGSPYVELIDAVTVLLPRLQRPDRVLVERLRRDGPPHEEVGVEPFAPPEYLGLTPAPGSLSSPAPVVTREYGGSE